jgi:hypothetical protein
MKLIRDKMVANLQAKITEINDEKGDTLINDFNSRQYFLPDGVGPEIIPNFKVSYFQFNPAEFIGVITNDSIFTATDNEIQIDAIIAHSTRCDNYFKGVRVQRAIKEVLQEQIFVIFPNSVIMELPIAHLQDDSSNLYTRVSVRFKITLC